MPLDIRTALARLYSRGISAPNGLSAFPQAVLQFNTYLQEAKNLYQGRLDLRALEPFQFPSLVSPHDLNDAILRLQDALNLEPQQQSDGLGVDHKFGVLRAESQLVTDFDASIDDKAGLSILFFDIDNFKNFNTKFTETVVDTCILGPLHHFLVEAVRQRGYCYSVGGDEFIILLRNCGPDEALAFAHRLARSIQDNEFVCKEITAQVTLSIGVSSFPADGETLQEVREKANNAENQAKSKGKNRVVVYSDP